MARPSADEMGRAIRRAYEAAGVRQEEIAEACDVEQTTVSKWANGQRWPPLHVLPIIDQLCGQPRGHILRLAGFVDDEKPDVEAAIEADRRLAWHEKDILVFTYNRFLTRSKDR